METMHNKVPGIGTAMVLMVVGMLMSTYSVWGLACLTPNGPISAEVEVLPPNPGGLERLSVSIHGFSLIDLSGFSVGCSIGFSLESEIVGAPIWLIQKRGIALTLAVVDHNDDVRHDFVINPSLALDLHGEALGLNYYTWPMPVAFMPFTMVQSTNPIPGGPVNLVFEVVVKPPYSVAEVIDDIEEFGHVASDFSLTYYGVTYLLWNSTPFVSPIQSVTLLP